MSNPLIPDSIFAEHEAMETNVAEQRRRETRKRLGEQALKNLLLTKENMKLKAELAALPPGLSAELAETKGQLERVTGLARTTLVQTVVLKRAIHLLIKSWKTASPDCPFSTNYGEDQAIRENIAQYTTDIYNDEYIMRNVDEKLEEATTVPSAWDKRTLSYDPAPDIGMPVDRSTKSRTRSNQEYNLASSLKIEALGNAARKSFSMVQGS